MMNFKSPSDIFEVAVRIERHSVELYVSLYGAARSAGAKSVFSSLAAEEEKHLGQIRTLLEEAADYEPAYAYPGEYELYVDGMAHRALESSHDMRCAVQARTESDALAVGINLERGKIAFYTSIIEQFEGRDRELMERLVGEEKKHLARLEALDAAHPEQPSAPR